MQPGPQMIKTTSGSIQADYQPGQKEPIIWVKKFVNLEEIILKNIGTGIFGNHDRRKS